MVTAPFRYATVDRLFPGDTFAILASGPSLTPEDVDACRGRARVLAIKDSIRLAPDADCLFACDAKWWRHHGPTLTYSGPRYALEMAASPWAQVLKNTGDTGLELQPDGLKTGRNSGFQAIGLAVHLGARRIVLLGYDMQPTAQGEHHWFGSHAYGRTIPPYSLFLRCFETIVEPLAALGIQVLNASRVSALRCFPRVTLAEAFA